MSRLVAIGDIHGQFTQFRELMEKVEPRSGDKFVFLGDLVDSGPQSAEVIEYLINFKRYRDASILLGNHDARFLSYLTSGYAEDTWLFQGGQATLQSYVGEKIPDSHYRFLKEMWPRPLVYETYDREYIFSHGFLCPTKDIKSRFKKEKDFLWGRPSTFGLKTGVEPDFAWGSNQFLVCGHTPHAQPTFYGKQALVIDTGAKAGRPITAAICPMGDEHMWKFVQA